MFTAPGIARCMVAVAVVVVAAGLLVSFAHGRAASRASAGALPARATAARQESAARASPGGRLGRAPAYRFVYESDAAPGAVLSYGWNLIDVGSQWAADRLPAGAHGLVWVGDYDNSTCSWEMSDGELKSLVAAAVGDPHVFGYFFSDEPNPHACPAAPAQHRARSHLIHSVDPRGRTVIVLDSNGFEGAFTRDALDQLPLWKGVADYVGLDPYPCRQGSACDFSWIARTIRAADQAGLNYWGVVQAFDDSDWRWPTPQELSRMLGMWGASRESGYMTFAWTWAGHSLAGQTRLLEVFRRFNGTASRPQCVVPRVIGLKLAAARAAIRRAHCAVGKVSLRYAARRAGRILAQEPGPRTRLATHGRVDLVVSRGGRR